MDVRNFFIAGMIFALVIFTVCKLIMTFVSRKRLCIFISSVNDKLKLSGFKGIYYDVLFGYALAFRNTRRISQHELDLMCHLIADSREKRCEIDIDRIKEVVK